MATTKTKKSTTKRAAKPKAKRTAKPKAAAKPTRTVKTRTVKLASGRKVERAAEYAHRTGTVRIASVQLASAIASALACTDGDGMPINRAPVSSTRVEDARAALRIGAKLTQTKAVQLSGAGDWTTLVSYADGTLGRAELPDGFAAKLRSLSAKKTKSGKTLEQRKMRGRPLAAALVGLAVQSGAKLPTGRKRPTEPVRIAASKR